MRKEFKLKLYQLGGCVGCSKLCRYNKSNIATKSIAMKSLRNKFDCNDNIDYLEACIKLWEELVKIKEGK